MTQSVTLSMFYPLMQAMKGFFLLDNVGLYVADSKYFSQYKQKYPEVDSGQFHLLKEWEIIKDSKNLENKLKTTNGTLI